MNAVIYWWVVLLFAGDCIGRLYRLGVSKPDKPTTMQYHAWTLALNGVTLILFLLYGR